MPTRNTSTEIERTFSELKEVLLEKDCRIISEEPPNHILVRHGSLRGVSPRNAKKIIDYRVYSDNSGSRIVSQSSVSSDWAKLTLWGNIAAGVVAAVFWWIASDIANFLVDGKSGYWTWLAEAFGYPNTQYAFFMVNITKALSVVLVVAIFLEILDVFIVYRKINTFAEETLDELARRTEQNL
ncbi:TPA: hypothetical protein HA273_00715 [Candidatus Bathyarchaeota archaeon]|nr:hypothetical protein [Candidatus Bathyarchaeota archaeon]